MSLCQGDLWGDWKWDLQNEKVRLEWVWNPRWYQSIIHSFKKCSVGYGIERSFYGQSIKERVKYFVLLFRSQGHSSRAFSKGLNYKVIRLRICKGLICMNVLFLFQIDFTEIFRYWCMMNYKSDLLKISLNKENVLF